ncbi:MAG: RNA 2',3'-cyclic phosphodiesterase [Elusimicrobia bacterium]|nr:RNA 2',3'-cyclic phosphodiesterase [Elusimicrobiota bacterium]
MRLFIAVPVDPVREKVGRIMNDLASAAADVKWVKPDNLHMTIQFLGETPQDKVEAVGRAISEACCGRPRFELAFGQLGAFPSLDLPRVIWLGIAEGADRLGELAQALARGLTGQGFALPEEGRGFKAHLTIGRVRSRRNAYRLKDRVSAWSPEKMGLPRVAVDRLVLYESRLRPGWPVYTVVKTAELA